MANYNEQVSAADFDVRVAGVREHLRSWNETNRQVVDQEDDGILDRIQALLDETLIVTAVHNQVVVPRGLIGAVTNSLVAVDAALTALDGATEETVTVALVADLTTAAETLANSLFNWPPRVDGENWRELVSQAASTFRRSAGQQFGTLTSEIEAARAELKRVEESAASMANQTRAMADTKAEEIKTLLDDLDTQVGSAQASVSAAVDQVSTAVTRSEKAIGTHQQQFADAQEERSKAYTATTAALEKAFTEKMASRDAQASGVVSDLKERLAKAENLVQVFTAAGTANAYSKEAVAQGKQADIWRVIAIVLGLLAAVGAGTVLLPGSGDQSWQSILGKFGVGIVLGALAGYAATQSARHRQREEVAKHLELNLATFGSLADELSAENLETARAELIKSMLVREEPAAKGSKDTLSDANITAVQRIVDMIRSAN